jgi:hypothetical protein
VAYLVSLCSKTVRHGMNMLSITFREWTWNVQERSCHGPPLHTYCKS